MNPNPGKNRPTFIISSLAHQFMTKALFKALTSGLGMHGDRLRKIRPVRMKAWEAITR
jgi:hypothetical protein